jgi:hypothetical protein
MGPPPTSALTPTSPPPNPVMLVLSAIFLRYATNRYDAACREIADDRIPRCSRNKSDVINVAPALILFSKKPAMTNS